MGSIIFGRTYIDIPETDGVVFIKIPQSASLTAPLNKGAKIEEDSFIKCRITVMRGYDLIGEISL